MDSRMYPQGSGGLRGKYVSGVLTLVNSNGATVYTINPSTKAVSFAGAATFEAAVTALSLSLSAAANAVLVAKLPTADPTVAGQLWANSGIVTVSAG